MPAPTISRDQIEDAPPFGYDLEVAHMLSAAGWVYDQAGLDQRNRRDL